MKSHQIDSIVAIQPADLHGNSLANRHRSSIIAEFAVVRVPLVMLLLAIASGCGSGQSDEGNRVGKSTPVVPPTVSIEQYGGKSPIVDPIVDESSNSVESSSQTNRDAERTTAQTIDQDSVVEDRGDGFETGSAMWLLSEISRLRRAPTDRVLRSSPNSVRDEVVLLSPEQRIEEQKRRNREILRLAQEAIVKTHRDPEQIKLFNSALDSLSEARLQLALSGDAQQAKLLERDASELYQNDSKSFAAVESSFRVLRFAQAQAQRFSSQDEKWAIAYANQSRIFAEQFPQEASRAAIHLVAAGKMCDSLRLYHSAKSCLSLVEEKFPDSPYSQQVAGIQRRLRLIGQPLQDFAGSTLSGGHQSIQDYLGRPLLIVFWASNSEEFRHDLPSLHQAWINSAGRLQRLGVCLDRDEFQAQRFAQESLSDWQHIFYSEPSKRGFQNVVADYYGVSKVPMYWLVDATGKVVSVDLPDDQLDVAVQNLLGSQTEVEVSLNSTDNQR